MCAIGGEIRYGENRVDAGILEKMRDSMIHRGPDGAGLWVDAGQQIGFVHRRLSILNPTPDAAQPMVSEGRYCLTFNGEIYNHAELRDELKKLGHTQWKTDHSDTEVIIKAFAEWGIDCVTRFRGMFAFAIWDQVTRELYLVRDRVGIKPLYYAPLKSGLLFASEIKALLIHPEIEPRLNRESLFHYLSFLTTPAPNTLFDGIFKLPCAHYLKIGADGTQSLHRYWDALTSQRRSSSGDALEDLRATLDESIALHQSPDAPMGIFLSGGLDSSLCTALFSKTQSTPLSTYSIGYSENHQSCVDELPFAWQMANHVGANFYEKKLSRQEFMDFLPRLIELQDEPIADPVCIPVHFVAKLAADSGVKVCQVGEGSDELFLGYTNWKFHLDLARFSGLPLPRLAKRAILGGMGWAGYGETFKFEALRRTWNDEVPFWSGTEAFTEAQKQRLLSPELRREFAAHSSFNEIEPIFRRFKEGAANPTLATWMSYVDLNLRLPELLLMRVDKMTMGASIESRVPFLDHKLVECAMNIPQNLKIHKGVQKYILKQTARGLVPDDLIDRKKQGFGVPLEEWLLTDMRQVMYTEIKNFCEQSRLLDWTEVESYFARNRFVQVWVLFNLARWYQTYFA